MATHFLGMRVWPLIPFAVHNPILQLYKIPAKTACRIVRQPDLTKRIININMAAIARNKRFFPPALNITTYGMKLQAPGIPPKMDATLYPIPLANISPLGLWLVLSYYPQQLR